VCLGFCKNSFHQNSVSECLCGSLSPYSDVGLSFIVKCDTNIMPLLMLFSCVHKVFAKVTRFGVGLMPHGVVYILHLRLVLHLVKQHIDWNAHY
jgi:hypothetical protein